MSIAVDELAAEITKGLLEYNQEVADMVKQAVDETTKEEIPRLKAASPEKTGSYKRGWTKRKAYENTRSKRNTIYNKTDYQITHLLEHGHASRFGGRVRAIPHIKPIEEESKQLLEKKIRDGTKAV